MRELTYAEESYILNQLMNKVDLFINGGCARMVFDCDESMASHLGIYDCTNKYIIKVALGVGGVEQMRAEVNLYLAHGDKGYLARVVAAGHFIEIMEKVDCWDFTDEAECGFDDDMYQDLADLVLENNAEVLTKRDAGFIADTILFLQHHFGITADNGQLGKTVHGTWVSYDYGFVSDKGRDSQTSDLAEYMDFHSHRHDYMGGLLTLLSQENTYLDTWEQDLLSIYNPDTYDDEDDEDSDDSNWSASWDDTRDWENNLDDDHDDTDDPDYYDDNTRD